MEGSRARINKISTLKYIIFTFINLTLSNLLQFSRINEAAHDFKRGCGNGEGPA